MIAFVTSETESMLASTETVVLAILSVLTKSQQDAIVQQCTGTPAPIPTVKVSRVIIPGPPPYPNGTRP